MTRANYVGSYYDWDTDAVMIWERDENGRRVVAHHAPHYFFVDDVDGEYTSIFGQKLRKVEFESADEMKAAQRSYPRRCIHESDIRPEAKVLMNEYYGLPTPDVHYAFLDIEVDYKSEKGFSSPENPYAPINAVTIYQSWTKEYLTYAVPPKGWDGEAAFDADIARMWDEHELGFKPNVVLCHNERELLNFLVAAIQDADIISGWNSEFFDLPYIIKRLLAIQPKLADKMSFIGCKPPKEGSVERFGSPAIVYTLYGRTHLDYLDLFKKFTFEGRTSYSLGNIAAEELDIPKLDYEGTLEQLYNRDFIHFITYNARDVEVLVKLDVKFKLIALVNQMAHENTVPFLAILGTVRYVETGIMNRAHNVHNLIAPDKAPFGGMNEKVEGAIVMDPHYGLHDWCGSVDLTSLYPSVIRMLNMSIETYVGQFSQEDIDWRGLMDDRVYTKNTPRHFKKAGTRHNIRYRTPEMIKEDQQREYTAVMANGEEITMTWSDWRRFIKDNGIGVSAFGTMFDQNRVGLVADTLTFWFAERKRLQAEKKRAGKELDKLKNDLGIELSPEMLLELKS